MVEIIGIIEKNHVIGGSERDVKPCIRKENKIRPDIDVNTGADSRSHGHIKVRLSLCIGRLITGEKAGDTCGHQNHFFHKGSVSFVACTIHKVSLHKH
jgi:hypothetical protein